MFKASFVLKFCMFVQSVQNKRKLSTGVFHKVITRESTDSDLLSDLQLALYVFPDHLYRGSRRVKTLLCNGEVFNGVATVLLSPLKIVMVHCIV